MITNLNNKNSKNTSNVEIYQSEDGQADIRVQFEDHSMWLNRQQLVELFGRDIKKIGKHTNNVFKEGELEEKSTVAKFARVQKEGNRQVEHYNLDVIISVGYRVKSKRGPNFVFGRPIDCVTNSSKATQLTNNALRNMPMS